MLRQFVLTAERTVTRAGDIKGLTVEQRLENGPFAAREKLVTPLRGRVQPCVRPIDAARMAAGPDEVRGSDPISLSRMKRLRRYVLIRSPARLVCHHVSPPLRSPRLAY